MDIQAALDELCDLWEEISHHNTNFDTLYSEEREKAYQMAMSALENLKSSYPICPDCKKELLGMPSFCPNCGKKMKYT